MSLEHHKKIALELGVREQQVAAVVKLLDEGATVPFISRYRKEMTGALDEVAITQTRDRIEQLRELDKRRESILKSIDDQGKLTDELKAQIEAVETLNELEDLYLPYKPKRKTKATQAKEKGLEPLALWVFKQSSDAVETEAEKFIDEEKGVTTVEEALQGARDIIAEMINEDQEIRAQVRKLYQDKGVLRSRVISTKKEEGVKYKDYYEWEESALKAPSHRILAMRRGEAENVLMLDAAPEDEEAIHIIESACVANNNASSEEVKKAIKDGYKRLLGPSMETELRLLTKQRADEEAIKVFSENLRQLLLAAPLGRKPVLALDPGFRTGCKVVCLDAQGKLLHNTTIYPNPPQNDQEKAGRTVKDLVEKYEIEAVAIGNGTAGRETESFVNSLELPKSVIIVVVNESGASVYSASETAREEFPEYDLTVRGAASIGRRLMDPLAELVKIDAKSIGVGQYQHDVDQNALKKSLDDVVVSCVNAVGVELNTASKQLLTYVSGLGGQLAQNIVQYRNENGPFASRAELKKVQRLGDKAFEQAAGFLRIYGGKHPLDQSAVHPERYALVEQMAKDLQCTVQDLMGKKELREKLDLNKYISEDVGLPTLQDIMAELSKPGRDPREQFEAFAFDDTVHAIEDLRPGMKLPGIVTNITKFGAFVDVGVHQDGLVHVSEMANRFVKDPAEVVKVQQKVQVTVMEVDVDRKRISLSMKSSAPQPKPKSQSKPKKAQEETGAFNDQLAKLKAKFGS